MALPLRNPDELKDRKRKVYAELPASRWIDFENECLSRGVTPYELASAILLEFLNGGLVESQTDDKQAKD